MHTMKNFDPNSLPYYSQGLRLYNVHHHFVKEMLDMWYKTDEDMLQDHAVLRLWSHINTYGRNLDPCVCGMKSDLFYESNDVWPSFDTKRTCKDLMDLAGFSVKQYTTEMSRRQEWCKNVEPFDKVKAIRKLLEKSCKDANPKCGDLYYDIHYQRLDMGMPELKTKEQLVNFLATFIWQVTAGVSDSFAYYNFDSPVQSFALSNIPVALYDGLHIPSTNSTQTILATLQIQTILVFE